MLLKVSKRPFKVTIRVANEAKDGQKVSTMPTDLTKLNQTEIIVKNGGKGGLLLWKAACSKGLGISMAEGKLRKAKADPILVTVVDRAMLQNASYTPHVTIIAKAGPAYKDEIRDFIHAAAGRMRIYFKVKV